MSRLTATRTLPFILGLLAAVAPAARAQTVPQTITFTARLEGTAGPLQGPHDFSFRLLVAGMPGTELWRETDPGVDVVDGLVDLELGTINPTIATAFAALQPLELEVTIDGIPLSPRVSIVSVPYALQAGEAGHATTADRATLADSANSLGGLGVTDFQRRVNGTCAGASAITQINADGSVSCVSGLGDITAVNTPAGFGLVGGVDTGAASLALQSCPDNQGLRALAGGWVCMPDNATVGQCAAGSFLTGFSVTGTPVCVAEGGTGDITAVNTVAGGGLQGGATSGSANLGLRSDCAGSNVLLRDPVDPTLWNCSNVTGPNSVGTTQLVNNSVATADLANNSVTQAKIANNAVGTNQIADLSVGSADLANGSVVMGKVNLPMGFVDGANISLPAGQTQNFPVSTSFPGAGNCMVWATANVWGNSDSCSLGFSTLQIVYSQGGTIQQLTGADAYISKLKGEQFVGQCEGSASASGMISVTPGATYDIGCRMTSNSVSAGMNWECQISYMCQ